MAQLQEETAIEMQHLGELLGSFYKATGMHVEAVDNDGKTFFTPAGLGRCEFCEFIRNQPDGEKQCCESYGRASREAAKWEEPYFFRCHAGLVLWAVPMILRGKSLGSIICGQVLMWEPDEYFWQEFRQINADVVAFSQLREKAKRLEIVSPDKAQSAADMLFIVVNHLLRRNIRHLEEQEAAKSLQQKIRNELEDRHKQASSEAQDYEAYLKKERKLLQFIRLGDKSRADMSLQSLLTDLYTMTQGDKETIRVRIFELAALVSRAAVEGGAQAERAMTMLQEFNASVERIDKIEDVLYRVQWVVSKFLEDIFALTDKKYLSLVKEARKYIMENYQRAIKIEDVANYLFISPSHLSRLFRQELDCTVNDYLTRVRIEKAVELMKRPELSVEQVSKAVGFNNQSYFAKVFKSYIGVTPLIYRNSLF